MTRASATLAVALALLALAASAQAACPDADLPPTSDDLARVAAAMVCLIDVERAHHGLAPVRSDAKLGSSATYHTRDMIASHFLAHQGPAPHPALRTRIVTTGYFAHAAGGLYTENIGIGPLDTGTARGVVDAWMSSPPHRANILRPEFRDIGVGAAIAPSDPVFYPDQPAAVYTTDFGRRYYHRSKRCTRSRTTGGGPSATTPTRFCSARHRARRTRR